MTDKIETNKCIWKEMPIKEDKNIKVLDHLPEHEIKVSRIGEIPGAYSIEWRKNE